MPGGDSSFDQLRMNKGGLGQDESGGKVGMKGLGLAMGVRPHPNPPPWGEGIYGAGRQRLAAFHPELVEG